MGLIKTLTKLFKDDLISGVAGKIEESIEEVQHKVSAIVGMVVKSLALFFMALIGSIILVVGFSIWLQGALNVQDGLGFVIVGGGLLVLAFIVKLLK